MSALEKFGILIILVLVVIIGMVAVWGVGTPMGDDSMGDGTDVAAVPDPGAGGDRLPGWPEPASPAPAGAPGDPGVAAVPPPVVDARPLPPVAVATPPAPAPAPAADTASRRTYTVRSGDTLAGIAASQLGKASLWKRIADANPGIDPRRLRVGATLVIPDGSGASSVADAAEPVRVPPPVNALHAVNPDDGPTAPGATVAPTGAVRTEEYEIQKGDTLSTIAARRLGKSSEWYRILEANPGLDPKRLVVGRRILVPVGQ